MLSPSLYQAPFSFCVSDKSHCASQAPFSIDEDREAWSPELHHFWMEDERRSLAGSQLGVCLPELDTDGGRDPWTV